MRRLGQTVRRFGQAVRRVVQDTVDWRLASPQLILGRQLGVIHHPIVHRTGGRGQAQPKLVPQIRDEQRLAFSAESPALKSS